MAQEIDISLNVNTEQADKSLGSLKSQLKQAQQEVQELAARFGATSEQAIEAAKRAAELADNINAAKDLTDSFNPDSKFKALASAANIAVGALAGYQGALGMIGVESENVENSILKIQSALALAEGLEMLQEIPDAYENIKAVAVDAFRAIKGAIGATGIGLLVIALGALYANWDALKKLVGDSIPALKEGTNQFDKLKEVFFGVGNAIVQYLLTPFKAVLKLLQLDFKGAIQEIKNGADVIGNYEKGAAKERQDQNDAYAKARLEKQIKNKENEIAVQKALGNDTYNLEKDNLHRKILLNKDNQEELEKLRQEERLLDAAHKKSLQDKQAAHNAELKKKREEALAEEKRKREETQKQRDEVTAAGFRKAEEEYDAILKREEEAREKNRQGGLTEIEQVNEKYNKLIQTAKDAGVSTIELEIEKANAINDIKLTNQKNQEAIDAKEIADAQIVADAKLAIQNAQLDNVSKGISLLQGLGIKNKAIQKALVIAENAAGIAKTIINTMAANAKAIAASPLTAGQPFVTTNTISGAIGVATSVAATAKALTALGGGGGGGGGVSLPSGGGAMAAPSFNVVGPSGTNQIAESIGARQSQPLKAFVVGGDVTTQQQLNRGIVENATLG